MVGGSRGVSSMRERGQSAIADVVMAPILGPDGQALAAHGWYDAESIADDGGTLLSESKESSQIVRFGLRERWPACALNAIKLQSAILD